MGVCKHDKEFQSQCINQWKFPIHNIYVVTGEIRFELDLCGNVVGLSDTVITRYLVMYVYF